MFNKWKFQAQTRGEHVVYRNCFWLSEQFLYTTCSPNVLQKEKLLTKIYLYYTYILLSFLQLFRHFLHLLRPWRLNPMKNLRSRRKSLTLKDNEDILESVQYSNFRGGIFYLQGKNSKLKICEILLQMIIIKVQLFWKGHKNVKKCEKIFDATE